MIYIVYLVLKNLVLWAGSEVFGYASQSFNISACLLAICTAPLWGEIKAWSCGPGFFTVIVPKLIAGITIRGQTVQITRFKTQYLPTTILIVVGVLVWVLMAHYAIARAAATYTDSAHGDLVSGVNRSEAGHDIGDCAHCHDTFDDSICGVNHRMLFVNQFTDQDSGVCVKCHGGNKQVGGIINYDYSRTRGGEESKDCPSNIKKAFKFIDPGTRLPRIQCDLTEALGSAHDLKNIRAYMKNKWGWGGVNAEVNPCGTCHNPHKAIKDYPCSLPSSHGNTWDIWGDESGEKMADYLDSGEIYQAPNKAGGGTERDADAQPNYVEFCLECHQYEQASFEHGTVAAINWGIGGDNHGKGVAGNIGPMWLEEPYGTGQQEYNPNLGKYVLCCTDCHEPHGSRNEWLLRTEVNGTSGVALEDPANSEFCLACHAVVQGTPHSPPGCDFTDCHKHGRRAF